MSFDVDSYAARMRIFLPNRARFPVNELEKYAGQWVAFCPDGTRVIASSQDPENLEEMVRAQGEDPLCCVIEGIPDGSII